MRRTACAAQRKDPVTFTASMRDSRAAPMFSTREAGATIPAQLISAPSDPLAVHCVSSSLNSSATELSSATSTATVTARTPRTPQSAATVAAAAASTR